MRLVPATSQKLPVVTVAGSRQVLKRTVTLAPTKTPVAPAAGTTWTTERGEAAGSEQVEPAGAGAEEEPPQPARAAASTARRPAEEAGLAAGEWRCGMRAMGPPGEGSR